MSGVVRFLKDAALSGLEQAGALSGAFGALNYPTAPVSKKMPKDREYASSMPTPVDIKSNAVGKKEIAKNPFKTGADPGLHFVESKVYNPSPNRMKLNPAYEPPSSKMSTEKIIEHGRNGTKELTPPKIMKEVIVNNVTSNPTMQMNKVSVAFEKGKGHDPEPLLEPIMRDTTPTTNSGPIAMTRQAPLNLDADSVLSSLSKTIASLTPKMKLELNTKTNQLEVKAKGILDNLPGKDKEVKAMRSLLNQVGSLAAEGKTNECRKLLLDIKNSDWGHYTLKNNPKLTNEFNRQLADTFLSSQANHVLIDNEFKQLWEIEKQPTCLILNDKNMLEAVSTSDPKATPENIQKGVEIYALLAGIQLKNGKGTLSIPTGADNINFAEALERVTNKLIKSNTANPANMKLLQNLKSASEDLPRTQAILSLGKYERVYTSHANFAQTFRNFPNLHPFTPLQGRATEFLDGVTKLTDKNMPLIAEMKKAISNPTAYDATAQKKIGALTREPNTTFENFNQLALGPIHKAAMKKLGDADTPEKRRLEELGEKVKNSLDPTPAKECDIATYTEYLQLCETILTRQ